MCPGMMRSHMLNGLENVYPRQKNGKLPHAEIRDGYFHGEMITSVSRSISTLTQEKLLPSDLPLET